MGDSEVLSPALGQKFVETKEVQEIVQTAITYLKAGYPIHLRGPAGIGKTTLAVYIARFLGRPIVTIFGNDDVNSMDFVGGQMGYKKKTIEDNFVHSVLKTEEMVERQWVDGKIINACKEGYTLIYDEFSRSSPEVNNILLSILEEKILQLPIERRGDSLIRVHPEFRAIFTSNPTEYAGVYKTQEALLDRMITINLGYWGKETETKIISSQSGLDMESAEKIIDIVRKFRESAEENNNASLRNAIMLGKVVKLMGAKIDYNDKQFVRSCCDILGGRSGNIKCTNMESLIFSALPSVNKGNGRKHDN